MLLFDTREYRILNPPYLRLIHNLLLSTKFDFLLFPKMTFVLLFYDDEDKLRGARENLKKMGMLDLFFKKKW